MLHDNVFGSQAEDAARRDFTANALYYDPATEAVIDYHHGVGDLKQKTLRMIGEPRARYREDPVRMLRAVRLAAKLGLQHRPGGAASRSAKWPNCSKTCRPPACSTKCSSC